MDFVANLSEDGSNSWCDSASMSANDPNNVDDYYDEEDDNGSPVKRKRFDKDDGTIITKKKRAVKKESELPTSPKSKPTAIKDN